MRQNKRIGARRLAAAVMAALLLAVVLSAALFMAAEADHSCSGDDCPVCACLRQCEDALRRLGAAAAAAGCCAAVPPVMALLAGIMAGTAASGESPVAQKVRLDN